MKGGMKKAHPPLRDPQGDPPLSPLPLREDSGPGPPLPVRKERGMGGSPPDSPALNPPKAGRRSREGTPGRGEGRGRTPRHLRRGLERGLVPARGRGRKGRGGPRELPGPPTQKMRLRKTRTVLEEVMPHCPMAAAVPRPPAPLGPPQPPQPPQPPPPLSSSTPAQDPDGGGAASGVGGGMEESRDLKMAAGLVT